MPYVYDPNLEDEDKEHQISNTPISGASPSVDSAGTPEQQARAQPSQNTGSGFQNLDKYLQTNNAQQFGQEVVGKVQNKVDTARQNINDASHSFGQKVESSNSLPNQQQLNQSIANPDQADQNQFADWRTQTYSGPHSLSESQDDYNKLWSGTNQANEEAKSLGTEAGRFALLDNYFGKPTYSYGQKSLDNLLLQEGGIGSAINQLQNDAAQLKTYGNNQASALQNQASQRAGQVNESRQGVRKAIGIDEQGGVIQGSNAGSLGKKYADVQREVDAENAARQAQYEGVKGQLQGGGLSKELTDRFGLPDNITYYNLNPLDYLSNSDPLTKDQVISDDERAYIQALSQLAGVTDTFASNPSQAKTDPYSFNGDRFKNDISTTQSDFMNGIRSILSQKGENYNGNPQQALKHYLDEKSQMEESNRIANSTDWNPYYGPRSDKTGADSRIDQLNPIIDELRRVYNRYGINPDTDSSNYLRTT